MYKAIRTGRDGFHILCFLRGCIEMREWAQ